uniref:NADH dehydrogenase subunit 2 n=1 Tax=Iphicrates gressitti TaxID=2969360 RepID=UPI002176D173|nr:NADH dehydrogenase subunit 2 [Iphicrates gressitti]UUJ37764.1 NADH dehydrogenase subunit 2 [Iphicrates gressitti]
MNFSKLLFIIMLILSTIISISSKTWIGMWMGMEMNLMSFIPILAKSKNKKSSKSIMIYFLVQSISSVIMLFFIMMSKLLILTPFINEMIINSMIVISLFMKLGIAPFHLWLPTIADNLSWIESSLLLTWQKIAPFYLLSMLNYNKLIFMSVILSAMIGAIGGLNCSSLMKIMAYSSINHMGWMLLMMIYQMQWFKYLLLYSFIVIMPMWFFKFYNLYFINQIYINLNSPLEKLTFSSMMLSMGGLPPFLGFLPKWMVLQSAIFNIPMLMFLTMMSLLTLFFYMRMISSLLLFFSAINKFNYKMYYYNFNFLIITLTLFLPLISIFVF